MKDYGDEGKLQSKVQPSFIHPLIQYSFIHSTNIFLLTGDRAVNKQKSLTYILMGRYKQRTSK